jgi:hypothetical protein
MQPSLTECYAARPSLSVISRLPGMALQGSISKAASLVSLSRGGEPALAVDRLVVVTNPVHLAQAVMDELTLPPH